jgi:Glutaminyl-tRNA synthetase, non-specific RNA binding region part 1
MLFISGVVVSAEEIKASVKALIEKKKKDLDSKRYQISGMLLGTLRKEQPWANSLALKEELDSQILDYLGPKDERDDLKAMVILF